MDMMPLMWEKARPTQVRRHPHEHSQGLRMGEGAHDADVPDIAMICHGVLRAGREVEIC